MSAYAWSWVRSAQQTPFGSSGVPSPLPPWLQKWQKSQVSRGTASSKNIGDLSPDLHTKSWKSIDMPFDMHPHDNLDCKSPENLSDSTSRLMAFRLCTGHGFVMESLTVYIQEVGLTNKCVRDASIVGTWLVGHVMLAIAPSNPSPLSSPCLCCIVMWSYLMFYDIQLSSGF